MPNIAKEILMPKVKKVLSALLDHLNIKNYQDFAEFIGVNRTMIYSWVKRDNIGDTGKILGKCPYINLDWLETGEGPMMIIDKDTIDSLPDNWPGCAPADKSYVKAKVKARIEPGNERQRERLEKTTNGEIKKADDHQQKEEWKMSDMLQMTAAVLESNTVYRSALASNVRAFYQAVKNEEEMHSILKKLEEMEIKDKEMSDRMTRMEEILIALGENIPQKRDQANG